MNPHERIYFRVWRQSIGLTQLALSIRMGYSRSALARAETRAYNVTLAYLDAFRDAVGAPSIPSLFSPPGEDTIELIEHFLRIPKKKRQALIAVARGLSERS